MSTGSGRGRRKRRTADSRGVSPVISTMIISGTLLIILVIASFVSANVLELQLSSTEFEQAKTNMMLLDDVIQDVALRQGSGGYVQFNQRSGGIGITEHTEALRIIGPSQQTTASTFRPNAAGAYQEWETLVGPSHWGATSDQNDATYIQTNGTGGDNNKRDIQNLQDPTFDDSAIINSVNVFMRAYAIGGVYPDKLYIMEKLGASERKTSKTIAYDAWNEYSTGPQTTAPDGAPWTKQKIADLQVGIQVEALGPPTEAHRVSEIWIVVNYTSVQSDLIYEAPSLISLVYRGGSKASGTDIILRGNSSLNVTMADSLSYLRVETDNGLQIKLDYNRVRIVPTGTSVVGGALYNFVEVTFLRLVKGNLGGSGTINLKVQNIGTNTTSKIYDAGSINIQIELGSETENCPFSSEAEKTVVIFTEVKVQVSTA